MSLQFCFDDKVVLITGASQGLGKELAISFARAGATVIITARREKEGTEVATEINASGRGRAVFVQCDVSDTASVNNLFERIRTEFKRLDVAVNNAGFDGPDAAFVDVGEEHFDKVMAVTVKGTFLCMQHEIRLMRGQEGRGSIVNMASRYGVVARAGLAPYVAAKHAVVGLSRVAAAEYAMESIRINALCSGAIEGGMVLKDLELDPSLRERISASIPAKRLGTIDEIVGTTMYMCSSAAGFLHGHALVMDGGYTAV